MPTGLWWYVTPSPAFGLRHCLASNLFAIRHAALQESKWYTFKRFILLTRVYSDPAAAAAGGGDTAAAGPSSSRPPAGPSAPQKKKKQKGEGSKVRLYRQQVLPLVILQQQHHGCCKLQLLCSDSRLAHSLPSTE